MARGLSNADRPRAAFRGAPPTRRPAYEARPRLKTRRDLICITLYKLMNESRADREESAQEGLGLAIG